MDQKKSVLIVILITCLLCSTALAAPTIDGSLADWGLGKLVTDSWGTPATWVPGSGISYIVEDNRDPTLTGGSTYFTGVHIKGVGSSYGSYYEKKVLNGAGEWVIEPVGGEGFDLEAIYAQQDSDNLYIAIVTSVNPAEIGGLQPGDIALNIDRDPLTGENGYEYGIVMGQNPPSLSGLKQGDIVYLPNWDSKGAILDVVPDVIVGYHPGGGVVGNLGTNLKFTNSWMTVIDNLRPNYVIEAAIPKAKIGATGKTISISDLFYADNCINDTLYVPEFPTFAISIGAILGVMFIAINLRNKN